MGFPWKVGDSISKSGRTWTQVA